MFLKNGLKTAKTGNSIDSPVQLQEFLGDVTFSNFVLLGSCFAWEGLDSLWPSLGAGIGQDVLHARQQPTQMPRSWQITSK